MRVSVSAGREMAPVGEETDVDIDIQLELHPPLPPPEMTTIFQEQLKDQGSQEEATRMDKTARNRATGEEKVSPAEPTFKEAKKNKEGDKGKGKTNQFDM